MAVKEIKYDPKKRTYTGTDNNDILNATTLDYVVPTEGKDKGKGLTITGVKGNDTITGTTGSDVINGGDGDDNISGGVGNDKLTGGKGKDIFIFTKNEGVDTITDADKDDIIRITGTSADKLKYGKQGNNLEIYYDDSMDENNKIVVKNYFKKFLKGQQPQIEVWEEGIDEFPHDIVIENYFLTGKGTITGTKGDDNIVGSNSKDTIKAVSGIDTIEGRGGNDTLYGGTTANSQTTFIFTPGDGQDVVNSGKGEDTLLFNDIENLSFEQGAKNKKDLVIRYSNNENDFVTVKNYFTVNKQGLVNGINSKNSIKHFIVNNQEISSGFIIGTAEKDRIYTYGDTTLNKIYACDGNDLINIDVDNITAYGGNGCDNVSINASGTTVYGGDGNDRISSFGTNNIIIGGKGNDRLTVSGNFMSEEEYQTVFIFNKGDGNDSLTSWSNHSVLKFADSSLSDLKLERLGDGLIIKYNSGKDSVMLRAFYGYDAGEYSLVDKNGQEKTLDDFIADYKTIPLYSAKKFVGNKDNDDFRLEDVKNLIVDASDGNDRMSITATGTTVYGGNGNDLIGIDGIDNTVYGGKGYDRFYVNRYYYGNSYEDNMESQTTFVFKKGDGNDRFLSYSQGDSVLKFADSLLSNLALERFGNSLVIKYNSGKDSITLEEYFDEGNNGKYTLIDKKGQEKTLDDFISEYSSSIPVSSTTEIIGTNYDDDINVRTNNLTVYGMKGNDSISISASGTTVYGGDGSDEINVSSGTNNIICCGKGNDLLCNWNEVSNTTLIFNNDDGNDIIESWANSTNTILKFNDALISDITIENKGSATILKYNSGKDSLCFNFNEYNETEFTIIDKNNAQISLNNLIEMNNPNAPEKFVCMNYISSQVAAFKGSNNSDNVTYYDNQNTNDILLVIPEYQTLSN